MILSFENDIKIKRERERMGKTGIVCLRHSMQIKQANKQHVLE